jgi:hypothetical protein
MEALIMVKRFFVARLILSAVFLLVFIPASWSASNSEEILYVLPFNQGEAPEAVTTALFDAMVNHLYALGEQRGIQLTIVKRELTDEDIVWFEGKQYLVGEISSYQEDKGCCYTEIMLTGQIQLHLSVGETLPILEVSDDSFFNHDITTAEPALAEITESLGRKLAERLLLQIDAI